MCFVCTVRCLDNISKSFSYTYDITSYQISPITCQVAQHFLHETKYTKGALPPRRPWKISMDAYASFFHHICVIIRSTTWFLSGRKCTAILLNRLIERQLSSSSNVRDSYQSHTSVPNSRTLRHASITHDASKTGRRGVEGRSISGESRILRGSGMYL